MTPRHLCEMTFLPPQQLSTVQACRGDCLIRVLNNGSDTSLALCVMTYWLFFLCHSKSVICHTQLGLQGLLFCKVQGSCTVCLSYLCCVLFSIIVIIIFIMIIPHFASRCTGVCDLGLTDGIKCSMPVYVWPSLSTYTCMLILQTHTRTHSRCSGRTIRAQGVLNGNP